MRLRVWLVALTLACARFGLAQVPEGERTLITDPAMLRSLGFPGDARNVYLWNQARLNQTGGELREPEAFGSGIGFATYSGTASFRGINSGFAYGTILEGIYCEVGTPGMHAFATAGIHPPNGSRLERVSWWWADNAAVSDDFMTLIVIEGCLPVQAAGTPTFTILATASTPSAAVGNGYNAVVVNRDPVNTKACSYDVRVTFRGNGQPCIGNPLVTYQIREEWRRQVSPPPATASFTDVPTGHPFYRFVEALAASGITGGCGGGLYCPDNPVTRAQMAVFLSTALGLHFGGIP